VFAAWGVHGTWWCAVTSQNTLVWAISSFAGDGGWFITEGATGDMPQAIKGWDVGQCRNGARSMGAVAARIPLVIDTVLAQRQC
jgi:hypothetical protein